MIKRIVFYLMFALLVIAFVLSFVGVKKVEFGDDYYNFLNNLSQRYNSWQFSIPNIPKISKIDTAGNGVFDAVSFFKWFGNVFVGLLNAMITVINVIILIFNTVIHVIQFISTLVYCVIDFKNTVSGNLIRVLC